ncbi:LytR family transcriptional attenuator [Luteimicrobium subarcticum]|uniref:LytR family transcriptional attenuator n=1 Tax=Luteimicrobium subarcticum TaxID=620910 RepID=A0A2M8WTM7_9MICO|nr:LytR family transcriptional attenuator [Luteimicrobium subarcticum]
MARWVGLAAVAVLASAGGLSYGLARHFQGNVDTQNIDWLKEQAAAPRPDAARSPADPQDAAAGKDLNILVLGSDWRGGDNDTVTKDQALQGNAQRSDTAMVMHVAANRKRIDVVSIARDTMVALPSCQLDKKGAVRTVASSYAMFNEAFARGWDTAQAAGWDESKSFGAAAACTWQTVRDLTGIRLDDYVVVDFAGFDAMVDALGGVAVCVPQDVDDPQASHLELTAGWQTLQGKTAISWARTRHGIADGSDTARIGRQQALVGSLANTFFAQSYVTDTPKMLKFVDAVTRSLHTSSDLGSLSFMTGLGFSLRNLDTAAITFRTVPWGADPYDENRVVWQAAAAAALWDKIAHDKPLGDITTPKKSGTGATTSTAPSATPTPKRTGGAGATGGKRLVTGMEGTPLSAADLPTTKAQCDAALKAAGVG